MVLTEPRPSLRDEAGRCAEHVQRRLPVNRGLTGLSQASGRSIRPWTSERVLPPEFEDLIVPADLRVFVKTVLRSAGRQGLTESGRWQWN